MSCEIIRDTKCIVVATHNEHKVKELQSIFEKIELVSLKTLGYNKEIVEDGSSFFENALIKAKTIYNEYKMAVLSDDSGLCIEALNGEPGIHSARFGGDIPQSKKNELILKMVKDKKNRDASFVCSLVLYINERRFYIVQEELKGEITKEARGSNGFGYDPIFFLPDYNKTLAELDENEKNLISHRRKASNAIFAILKLLY